MDAGLKLVLMAVLAIALVRGAMWFVTLVDRRRNTSEISPESERRAVPERL